MSRSYRKPWVTDGYRGSKHRQFNKRYANKVLKKIDDIPNGNAYRKFFCSWNICDYRWLEKPDSWFYKKAMRK